MNKLSDVRAIRRLIFLLSAAYFVSYLTRINFGAVLYDMVQKTGFSKESLSSAITGAFVTYGAGQLVSGWLGDLLQPKKLLRFGLVLSCAMNLLIPLCPTPVHMMILWCINGFAQAFMWPPMVRLMAAMLHQEDYRRCVLRVNWAASLSTVAMYLISPVLISLASWHAMFWFSAAAGAVMLVFWQLYCPRIEPAAETGKSSARAAAVLLYPMMLAIMGSIVLMGALRDGITTWMPTYIGETYHLGTGIATLTGVAMPLLGIGFQQLASVLYKKLGSQPLTCAAVLTVASVLSSLLLIFTTGRSAALSVLGAALLTGSMHGVNMCLISFLPSYFRNSGCVSTVSGVLNACVYIGSALSTYGFAAISEQSGWDTILVLWLMLSAAVGLICLLCIPAWKKRF